ncbi:MAG TPA: sugar transferase [Streptosporangiaceae bacterium]|nr:sugar transferase [Streptosporangiaceae bacterium]
MVEETAVAERVEVSVLARLAARKVRAWTSAYKRQLVILDVCSGLAAGWLAFEVRFGSTDTQDAPYIWLGLALPVLWLAALELAGAFDDRFVGVGTDEFRRVVNAGVCLTAVVAIFSYATKTEVARGYVVVALPCLTLFDLGCRYWLRRRLHKLREQGACMRKVVIVGHEEVISELTAVLRRETYHGMTIVAACVVGTDHPAVIDGIPIAGGLADVTDVVRRFQADTVAILACREMMGVRLRNLAWALEKAGTEICVAPALLDVAGPRTTIRPIAGLPLLHMEHPEFSGAKRLIKAAFDKAIAGTALFFLVPLLGLIALAIAFGDRGPVLFRQTRVGKDGTPFVLFKFRTMVVDAELRKAELIARNDSDGVLFKMRKDPRVTRVGGFLRRYSLDELPQLFNVLLGNMSLVGPRPALPDETTKYGDYVRRRLAVKPGITGLWQVNGRSNLPWDEAVRLDVRYVENWSLFLDLQILWKTWSAVTHAHGAY